jgi:hypothetical protein
MTHSAQRDEILFGVVSQLALRADVVDLEIFCWSTVLAAPCVALKHEVTKATIGYPLKPYPRPLPGKWVQG